MNPQMSPEAIDGAIIQLNTMLDNMPGIPDAVKDSGKKFVAELDIWSGDLKKQREKERAQGQPAAQK